MTTDNSTVIQWSNGSWTRNDRPLFPTEFWVVVDKNNDERSWFDFSQGQWSGVVNPQCLTSSKSLALWIASCLDGEVRQYSLIHHP